MALKISKQTWQQIKTNTDENTSYGRKQYNITLSGSAY